jgi:HAD superfamily phosphoserine phosphatase-like hydrolase
MPAYASVIIDVDSTLCGVEGIDFLAARRGPAVTEQIVALTDQAMKGEIPLESIYGHRLTTIRPTRSDIAALAAEYERTLAPGAADAIEAMRTAGVRLVLVSGGIREAIEPVARRLGFASVDLHAVSLRFDDATDYLDFDRSSPLTTQPGKPVLVRALIEEGRLPRRVLAVGDGATDAKLVGVVDTFVAYTGFARRANVVAVADGEVASFARLEQIVTGAD